MKDSEIYLRAAEAIADGVDRYTCFAVAKACEKFDEWAADKKVRTVDRYVSTYADDAYELRDGFITIPAGNYRQNARVLALLFMHQIAKDSERKS